MSILKYLETKPLNMVIKYRTHLDFRNAAIPFTGTPRKHPYDKKKILLILDPLGTNACFYEFKIDDILHIEDKSNLVTDSGELLPQKEVWVKKGSLGLRYHPFKVDEEMQYINDLKTLASFS